MGGKTRRWLVRVDSRDSKTRWGRTVSHGGEEIDRDMLYSNLEEDEVKIADNTQGLIKNPAGRQFSETTVRPTSSTSLVRGQSRDQLGRGQSRERLGLGQSLDRLGFSGAQTVGKEAPLDSARRGRGDSSDRQLLRRSSSSSLGPKTTYRSSSVQKKEKMPVAISVMV